MFERFTDRSRRAVILAQECAKTLGESYISTEHLVIGIYDEEEHSAAKLLQNAVQRDQLFSYMGKLTGRIATRSTFTPYAPELKTAFEMALREAIDLNLSYIDPACLLLGILRVPCEGANVLHRIGITKEMIIDAVSTELPQVDNKMDLETLVKYWYSQCRAILDISSQCTTVNDLENLLALSNQSLANLSRKITAEA